MATKSQLMEENQRLQAALERIDDQWNGWRWLSGPESASIASRALKRPPCTIYGPGSILNGRRRTNWCLVYKAEDETVIVPGSEMRHRPTVDEIAAFRRQIKT